MPRFLIRLLLAVAAIAFVGGACSSSDDDDASDDADQIEEDGGDEEATDTDGDEASAAESDDRANALDLIEQIGFSGEGAECIVDNLEESGIDLAELDVADTANPDAALVDALAQAGAACAEVIAGDGLPAGATDLSNPQVYDAFVQGFASTSGVSTEVATCVADYLLENDIDPGDVISGDTAALTDAMSACQ